MDHFCSFATTPLIVKNMQLMHKMLLPWPGRGWNAGQGHHRKFFSAAKFWTRMREILRKKLLSYCSIHPETFLMLPYPLECVQQVCFCYIRCCVSSCKIFESQTVICERITKVIKFLTECFHSTVVFSDPVLTTLCCCTLSMVIAL